VGDEVLVGFEQGDINHPYILGFLWNGQDRPPTSSIDTHVRRLKTVSGHILEFDDRSGSERVLLTTQGGQKLEMKDTPQPEITLQTNGGHKIVMSESTPAKITIQTQGGQKVELNDVPGTVTISDTSGNRVAMETSGVTISSSVKLTINCSMAEISAGMVTISAGMTRVSGVLQADTVITNAVISTSYTPGAGNIW
jgi:uncharacterized protein involved in type VI secretion and phage assembly